MDVHPTKNVSIGIDPYPHIYIYIYNCYLGSNQIETRSAKAPLVPEPLGVMMPTPGTVQKDAKGQKRKRNAKTHRKHIEMP